MHQVAIDQARQAILSIVPGVICTYLGSSEDGVTGATYHEFNVTPSKGHVNLTADTFFNKGKKLGLLTHGVRGATGPQKIVTYVNTDARTEVEIKGTNTRLVLSIKVTIKQ